MPRAEDIPVMEVGDHPVPAKSNPLGTKGCGEAGCAGSLSTIVNAVLDALSEYGITHIDMPLTPGAGLARDPGREEEGGVSHAHFAVVARLDRATQYSRASRCRIGEAAAYWFPRFRGG